MKQIFRYFVVINLQFTWMSFVHACLRDINFDKVKTAAEFRITIGRDPNYYVPKATYIVHVESLIADVNIKDIHLTSKKLQTVEETDATEDMSYENDGWFHLMPNDANTRFSEECVNEIIQKNASGKGFVGVYWTAPKSGASCILFKSKIITHGNSMSESNVKWIMKEFCDLEKEQDRAHWKKECCPCDEATYKVIFQGLWSNETHPKHFPPSVQFTHFSDIIGASHGENYTIWNEGLYATEGIRQVAEFGSISILDAEMRENKKHIRSLIKLNGLWYPNILSNTSGKFRVDRRHNLITMITMIGPSPDWFVGVSGINLCTNECTWKENMIVDLYPYDAGTDSGISYLSLNAPTLPQERIHRITENYPEDPRAPFYNDEGEKMKPLGRLYLSREHLTKIPCNVKTIHDLVEEVEMGNKKNMKASLKEECLTTNYSEWSTCSANCGRGLRVKIRAYKNETIAKMANCSQNLIFKEICTGATLTCWGDVEEDDSLFLEDDNCKVSVWSDWSECTVSCGIGMMTRARHFESHSSYKKCRHVQLLEKKKCMEPPCKNATYEEKNLPKCPLTDWSDWSPCIVPPGESCTMKGTRIRMRHLLLPFEEGDESLFQICQRSVKLEEKRQCKFQHFCKNVENNDQDVCVLPLEAGPCRGEYTRWYYNNGTSRCVEFQYGGCRGNLNNFLTQEDCAKSCLYKK